MRRAARVDANQAEIVEALRQAGASVQLLHMVGQGCPDLAVGFRGANFMLEIKQDRGKLTAEEYVWLSEWRGQAKVVRSPEEALRAIGAL